MMENGVIWKVQKRRKGSTEKDRVGKNRDEAAVVTLRFLRVKFSTNQIAKVDEHFLLNFYCYFVYLLSLLLLLLTTSYCFTESFVVWEGSFESIECTYPICSNCFLIFPTGKVFSSLSHQGNWWVACVPEFLPWFFKRCASSLVYLLYVVRSFMLPTGDDYNFHHESR